jgi:hypothetical protein
MAAVPEFTDVRKGDWFAPYIAWGCNHGIVNGQSGNKFAPYMSITREQACAILQRFADYTGTKLPALYAAKTFSDSARISPYASAAVTAMQRAGLISGYSDGSFAPGGSMKRCEVAKVIYLILEI